MHPVRVLLAHPDAELLSACQEALVGDGFAVTTATSGLECLSRLQTLWPDLIVLDADLPWGGGDGVLAWLNEEGDHAPRPVVILSSCSGRFAASATSLPLVGLMQGDLIPARVVEMVGQVAAICWPEPALVAAAP